jgi:hypothetical protein
MYKEPPVFPQPPNENEKVWRYTDFTKFISFIESGSLYFTSADKFEDPLEGSYPKINVSAYEDEIKNFNIPEELKSDLRERNYKLRSCAPSWHFVNCWHLNSHESAAMWKLYLKSNEGITIQSTYQKLRDCFSKIKNDIFIGQVKYIDYETESIDTSHGNIFSPFVHKRKSFEHGKEVRAITIETKNPWEKSIVHGLNIPVNLDILIENIYVAPNAPPWFESLVKSVIKRYGAVYPVIKSNLEKSPLY